MLSTRSNYKYDVYKKLIATKKEINLNFNKLKKELIANHKCHEMVSCAQIKIAAINSINIALYKLDKIL